MTEANHPNRHEPPAGSRAALRQHLATQDNRATAHPLFVVQQRRREYGYDLDYTDDVAWLDGPNDNEEAPRLTEHPDWLKRDQPFDPELVTHEQLEEKYQETGEEPDGWTRTGYVDRWEFVTACFTEQGCLDYLCANGHNLCEPRIYVESAHRNREWQRVRAWLMEQHPDPACERCGEDLGYGAPAAAYCEACWEAEASHGLRLACGCRIERVTTEPPDQSAAIRLVETCAAHHDVPPESTVRLSVRYQAVSYDHRYFPAEDEDEPGPVRRSCAMGQYCPEHGFIHGEEAEELREEIEKFVEAGEDATPRDLARILQRVDARDSIAFLEQGGFVGRREGGIEGLPTAVRQVLSAALDLCEADREPDLERRAPAYLNAVAKARAALASVRRWDDEAVAGRPPPPRPDDFLRDVRSRAADIDGIATLRVGTCGTLILSVEHGSDELVRRWCSGFTDLGHGAGGGEAEFVRGASSRTASVTASEDQPGEEKP